MSNIKIEKYVNGLLTENCYLIINNDTNHGFIIDPGMRVEDLTQKIDNDKITIDAILLTHGHFDHSYMTNELMNKYKCKTYASKYEKEILENEEYNLSKRFGKNCTINEVEYLEDDSEIVISDIKIKCIRTSGHTIGGMCFLLTDENVLFSGDTLFKQSFGRYDLYSGNLNEMKESLLNKLFLLDDNIIVYPGHGDNTTIANEKQSNIVYKF